MAKKRNKKNSGSIKQINLTKNIASSANVKFEDISVRENPKGVAGTAIISGSFEEEYLEKLQFTPGYEIYDKMRRSDYQITRIISAINTPILSANWAFIPNDPNDPEQMKQADFKNKVLKEWMNRPFRETLNNILSYLIFGFAVFEPTFKVIEDKDYGTVTTLNDLGFRKQNSIEKWFLNEDGTIKAIRQEVTGTDNDVDVLINGDEILVFTNDKEGDNYEGISLLRGSYGPWLRKQMFHKIEYIGIEKNSIGTPIFYAPKSLRQNAKEKKNLEDILN